MNLWSRSRARIGYGVARRLLGWRWAVSRPGLWRWMQGQYARQAALGDPAAQSFYGHVLLFRGVGLGAREEGLRLLGLAARQGDAKAAYQLGIASLKGMAMREPSATEAASWLARAAEAGHPLAAGRLAELLEEGAPGLAPDAAQAARYRALAARAGL